MTRFSSVLNDLHPNGVSNFVTKRATEDNSIQQEESLDSRLIGAFKMNAMFQIRGLSRDDAKRKYIELVNKYITE